MMAATDSSSLPGHWRSSPADAGIMPVVSARCPPAGRPLDTLAQMAVMTRGLELKRLRYVDLTA